jgi:hypothetical protein
MVVRVIEHLLSRAGLPTCGGRIRSPASDAVGLAVGGLPVENILTILETLSLGGKGRTP